MKLGDALSRRANLDKKLTELKIRIGTNAIVQEGDTPAEPPGDLIADALRVADELRDIVRQINRTNALAKLDDEQTIADALTARDWLKSLRSIYLAAVPDRNRLLGMRATRSELRVVAAVNVAETQRQADDAARRFRELDARIQEANWTTELL